MLKMTKGVRSSELGVLNPTAALFASGAYCFHSTCWSSFPDFPLNDAFPGFCLGLPAHLSIDIDFYKEVFGFLFMNFPFITEHFKHTRWQRELCDDLLFSSQVPAREPSNRPFTAILVSPAPRPFPTSHPHRMILKQISEITSVPL